MRLESLTRPLFACVLAAACVVECSPASHAAQEAGPSALPAPEVVAHFEKSVRPLLLQRCAKCHGAKKQEGSLRLDTRLGVTTGGDGGAVVIPGKPDESSLIAAVRHAGDRKMPPDAKLRPEEIDALVAWVKSGAYWPKDEVAGGGMSQTRSGAPTETERSHWSFQPLRRPTIPDSKHDDTKPRDARFTTWDATPIDWFVRARLEAAGLAPRPEADRRTLLRRVTFDLTGLPPTRDEIAAFLSDTSPDAYARVVDRLLASPRYGERQGRHWLDVVRYADTAGDGADYPVPEAHFYRNWVIRAFNADLPFDEFLRRQIAGDILAKQRAEAGTITPDEYADLVTATGFLAVTKRFGYNVNTDFQHLDIADTIETVGRSLLGLSLGCARCHDHKYEPVTVEDYYGLYGVFASSVYAFPGGEEHKRPANFVPLLPPKQLAELERTKQQELTKFEAALLEIERERSALDEQTRFAGGVDLAFEGQKENAAPGKPWFTAGPNVVGAASQSPFVNVHPAGTRGLRVGKGVSNDGIRMEFAPRTAAASPVLYFNLDFRNVDEPENAGAWRLYVGHGAIITTAIECSVEARRFSIRNGDAWEEVRPLEPGVWYNVQFTLDLKAKTFRGRIGRKGDVVEIGEKKCVPNWDGTIDVVISDNLGQRKGTVVTRDFDNWGLDAKPLAPIDGDATASPIPPATATAKTALSPAELREKLASLDERKKKTTAERDAAAARFTAPVAYALSEGTPQNAKIQKRGEPTNLGPEVPRRWLALLGGDALPTTDTGSGRRALAEWVTRRSNPLTARVFVNRVWQHHFGTGLVATSSDFGLRGEAPVAPELLDWLACELVGSGEGGSGRGGEGEPGGRGAGGQGGTDAAVSTARPPRSIKDLHRLIVLSATYRQSCDDGSVAQPSTLNPQPAVARPSSLDTRPLRPARRRLEAEAIHDAMLFVGGNLIEGLAGPHPFPPSNTWGFTIHYPFHAVYESNHRGVYLMVQRARKHPFLSLFDGADPNLSTDVRPLTTTPTQSLFLMNDPFVHRQAEGLARRLLAMPGTIDRTTDAERFAVAHEAVAGTLPDEVQTRDALAFLQQYRDALAVPVPNAAVPSEEARRQQAWNALCRVLLTSNAALFVE